VGKVVTQEFCFLSGIQYAPNQLHPRHDLGVMHYAHRIMMLFEILDENRVLIRGHQINEIIEEGPAQLTVDDICSKLKGDWADWIKNKIEEVKAEQANYVAD